jgi:hypothetical protein
MTQTISSPSPLPIFFILGLVPHDAAMKAENRPSPRRLSDLRHALPAGTFIGPAPPETNAQTDIFIDQALEIVDDNAEDAPKRDAIRLRVAVQPRELIRFTPKKRPYLVSTPRFDGRSPISNLRTTISDLLRRPSGVDRETTRKSRPGLSIPPPSPQVERAGNGKKWPYLLSPPPTRTHLTSELIVPRKKKAFWTLKIHLPIPMTAHQPPRSQCGALGTHLPGKLRFVDWRQASPTSLISTPALTPTELIAEIQKKCLISYQLPASMADLPSTNPDLQCAHPWKNRRAFSMIIWSS